MTTTVLLAITPDTRTTALAQLLLRRGCRVVVTGTDVGALLDAVRGFGADRTAVVVGDLHDPRGRSGVIATATQCFGMIDHVVDTSEEPCAASMPLATAA